MVTGDTGPMHLAAAVGTPIVAVFGPSDPAPLRAARRAATRRARRSALRAVQPHPAAARALHRPHARLPGAASRPTACSTPRSAILDDCRVRSAERLGMTRRQLRVDARRATAGRARDYLDADAEEAAHDAAMRGSRRCATRRSTARRSAPRFTVRGDSLWWFTELYLHKQQVDPRHPPGDVSRSTR